MYTPNNIPMHDYWIFLVSLAINAKVYFDPTPHILYRQHGNNVIGGLHDNIFKIWYNRFIKIFKEGNHYYSKMALELLKGYSDMISNRNFVFLTKAANPFSLRNRFNLLFNYKMLGSTFEKTLVSKIQILIGKF